MSGPLGDERPRDWLSRLDDFERDRSVAIHGPAVVRAALDALGAPDRALRVVSVAGTAGKGSVATFLAALLDFQGLRTLAYRSPHLCAWEERFLVAQQAMDPLAVDEELEQLRLATEAGILPPLTRFEVETVLAASLAAREGCEVLVAEAGLGAAGDATAAFDPELALVTSIGDDHRRELGGTLKHVARAELGIAERAQVVLLGELGEVGTAVAERVIGARNGVVWLGRERRILERRPGVAHQSLLLDDGRELLVPYLGRPAAQSVALAVWAADALVRRQVPADLVDTVAERVRLPGAPWLHAGPPRAVSDLAHNPLAAAALAETIAESFPRELTWTLVVGLTHDRDPAAFLTPLAPLSVVRVLALDVGVASERILDVARNVWPGARCEVAASLASGLAAEADADPSRWVLVTGSHRVVAPLRCS